MTNLTKKHFNEIAKIIKESRNFPIEIRETNKPMITNTDLLINRFVYYFKELNPLFDEDKFREACLN